MHIDSDLYCAQAVSHCEVYGWHLPFNGCPPQSHWTFEDEDMYTIATMTCRTASFGRKNLLAKRVTVPHSHKPCWITPGLCYIRRHTPYVQIYCWYWDIETVYLQFAYNYTFSSIPVVCVLHVQVYVPFILHADTMKYVFFSSTYFIFTMICWMCYTALNTYNTIALRFGSAHNSTQIRECIWKCVNKRIIVFRMKMNSNPNPRSIVHTPK